MSVDIKNLHKRLMETNLDVASPIGSTDDLLKAYPGFTFSRSIEGPKNIWHDLMKKASPLGLKNKREYDQTCLDRLIQAEMNMLLQVYILARKLLQVKGKVNRLKKVFLKLVEYHFRHEDPPFKLETGGGASPRVKRVAMIFHQEGKVNPGSRNAPKPNAKPTRRGRNGKTKESSRPSASSQSLSLNTMAVEESWSTADVQDQQDSPKYNYAESFRSFASMLRSSNEDTTFEETVSCINDAVTDFDQFLDSINDNAGDWSDLSTV